MSAHAPAGSPAPSQESAGNPANGRTVQQFLKDVGLFLAAPFVTLAYLVLFPFIGAVLVARTGRQSLRRRSNRGH